MKDKEKQIEEMAKDLKEVETDVGHILINETFSYVKEHKNYNPKKDFSFAHSKTFEELTAEEMLKRGYYKEKIENLEKTINEEYADISDYKDLVRKETAEKIYKLVDKKLELYRNGVIGGSHYDSGYQTAIYDIKRTIKDLFKIEIKE